jgi:CHAT domain-containing protein
MWVRRYDRTAESASLDEAHRLISEVLADTHPSDPALPHRRNLLGAILLRRAQAAEGAERLTLLQEAGECFRAAADAAGDRPPAAMYRSNLAACLHSRFDGLVGTDLAAAQEALNEAIGLNRQAIAQTPQDGFERTRYVLNLAATLTSKAKYLGDLEILGEAQGACEGILAREHDSVRDRCPSLAGAIYRTRFDLTGDPKAARDAHAHYLQAAHVLTSAAADRIHFAAEAGAAAELYGDHHTGYTAMRDGLDLFDRALSPALAHRDQERMLAGLTALPRDAAAMAIAAGQFDTALDLMERGRSVLLNRMSAARSAYDRLAAQEPLLADALRQAQGALDRAQEPAAAITVEKVDGQTPGPASPTALSRIDLARRYEELLAEIRTRPGLQDFLRPQPPPDLSQAAAHGPVIVVNVSDLRCDALVLHHDGLVHVPLPDVSARDVAQQATAFVKACGKQAVDASTEVVEWTWDMIAEPILNALRISAPTDGQAPPRVWWCPTGMAVFLPLHAAGRHRPTGEALPRSVPDFTVPSYTATVSSLMRLRALAADPPAGPARMLAVGVATSPFATDAEPLQSVASDMDLIRASFHAPTVLQDQDAVCARVLESMAQHSHVHFACHGQQDPASPFDGHLHMHDDRLSIRRIAQQHVPGAHFAFMNACETFLGGTDLPDEAVTVAAALHLASYREVVATHWQVNDSVAGLVAEGFYQRAIVHVQDGTAIGVRDIADALRRAMLEVRAEGAPPLYWGPFIHDGP